MEEPKCNVTEVIRALRESKELRKNEIDADFWIESKERDVEYRRLQEEQPNQIIDTNVNPSKMSVTVSSFTLSVESEVSNQTSKGEKTNEIGIEQKAFCNSFQRVEHQPGKANENEMQKLVEEYKIGRKRTKASQGQRRLSSQSKSKRNKAKLQMINYLKIGISQYVNKFNRNNPSFSANPIVPKKDFKVTKMQFKTSEKQISGTSITSELVMAKNEDSITGDFKSQLLLLGDLKSNHFNIALRNVFGGVQHIKNCLHSLRELGFLNFFSPEFLFATNSYLIGKELVLGRWHKAIDLIIEPMLIYKKPSNLALACFEYKSSRDVLKAVNMIDENQMDSVYAKLLFSIKQHGENLAEALNAVPFKTRKSCVHAYLGLIWNQIVSKRIAKFSLKLIIGDLVYYPQHNQVIFIDDGNIHKYTIYDVVLPLPGPDIIYPANEIAGWYDDLFKADGLTKNDFNRNSKIYGLDGVYRFLIVRPSDLKWKFVRYKEKETKLICSDPERQLGHSLVDVQDCKFLGLVLEFNLPTFAFASMALREILKMDITNTYEDNQLDRSLKRPLAANEIIIKQPQIKKTAENPRRITAPTPETNNFFLGSRAGSATSELSQTSPLKKIKLESDTVDKQPPINSSVEQPTSCPSSNSESQLNQPLEQPATIDNLPSSSPEKLKVKLEQENFNQMPQLSVDEILKEPQTKCVEEEPGISQTRRHNQAYENERQKLVKEYMIGRRTRKTEGEPNAKLLNKKKFKTGLTHYVNHNPGFSANQSLIKGDLQVKKMQFMAAEKGGQTSITSELVMAKNEDSITGDFKSQLLPLGDLKGNHFHIALRTVIGDQCHIENCLHSLRNSGFLNFFSSEFVFGNSFFIIGKELLLGRWQEAIDLIIEPRLKSQKPNNLALACFVYKSSRDVLKAVNMMGANQMNSVYVKLLFSIKQHGENLAEALNAVPLDLRKSYVYAYLGFIWNKIVSRRIAKFSLKLIIGDLVYDPHHNQVIFIDDGNIHKYTIYDVVLPLPGPDTLKPANEIAEWYDDLFREDGLTEKDFNRSSKIYGLDGFYRFLIIRPSHLKWKFIRYNGKRTKLLCSDSERLPVPRHPPVDVKDGEIGEYVGLVLEFNLPTFAFASMALREMLKMNITNTNENNQLNRSLKRPLAAKEIIINQPQIQKTDENPCRITAPTPETNNFFLGSRAGSATSELSQTSPLKKNKLESDTVDKQPPINSSVEQPTSCPSSNSESQLNLPLEQPVTIENLPSSSPEKFQQLKVKLEQENFQQSSTITKDSSANPLKNRNVAELSLSNQMPQLSVDECLEESQTKCVKEDPGIRRTRSSTLIESCAEEPVKKKIKADPDAKPSNFKSIIYIDLASDEED